MSKVLPFEIREAVVSVCGKAFWLKDPYRAFLLSCGAPSSLYDRYADESKHKIARHILYELDLMGEEGQLIQQRIVTALSRLRKVPDENVTDKDAAIDALRRLKKLAIGHKLLVEEEKSGAKQKAAEAHRKQAALASRTKKMDELRKTFSSMVISNEDPQSRGYGLEDLLAELFETHEISYRRP